MALSADGRSLAILASQPSSDGRFDLFLVRTDKGSGGSLKRCVLDNYVYPWLLGMVGRDHPLLETPGGRPRLEVWDVGRQKQVWLDGLNPAGPYGPAYCGSTKMLALPQGMELLQLRFPRNNAVFRNVRQGLLPGFVPNPVAFSPDGSLLATYWGSGRVRFLTVKEARFSSSLQTTTNEIDSMIVSPHNQFLCCVNSHQQSASVWQIRSGKMVGTYPIAADRLGLGFSADERALLSFGSTGIKVWNLNPSVTS